MTHAQKLKVNIIVLLNSLLDDQEEDITTGIEDGLYKADENVKNLQEIEDNRKLVAEFKAYQPAIYIYVSGGNTQGASATEDIIFNLYDADNYEQSDADQQEDMGSPEEWDENIKELTAKNEIIGIY